MSFPMKLEVLKKCVWMKPVAQSE